MKKFLFLIIILLFTWKVDAQMKVGSSPELYNLVSTWVSEFNISNPSVNFDIQNTFSEINFTTEENFDWKLVVGRDIIVPIMNSNNPSLKEIYKTGISPDNFAKLNPNNFYIIDNELIKADIMKFTKTKIVGNIVKTPTDLILSIKNNPNGIGFCRLADISSMDGLSLVPIDKDSNGKIDYFEKIYDNLNSFIRGVWIGKYPNELSKNIYVVSSVRPTDENTRSFLIWVITTGQQYLISNGYCNITNVESESNVQLLANNTSTTVESKFSGMWMLLIILFLITGVILYRIFIYKENIIKLDNKVINKIDSNSILVPSGLFFDKAHTWASMEKDGNIKIGIDDFIPHITGKITKVQMKSPGEKIKKGEKILVIGHNAKRLYISSPISGVIKEQNEILFKNPSAINSSPYENGWIYSIETNNWFSEIQFLLSSEKYREWIKNEFIRLKDFLSVHSEYYSLSPVLQDGGELVDNVLEDLYPEIWEDFQSEFMD